MYKIFDIHTHAYPDAIASRAVDSLADFYSLPVEGDGTHAQLEDEMTQIKSIGFLLFAVAINPHQVHKVNDSVAAFVHQSRERGFLTAGFGGIHQDSPDMEEEIERMLTLGLQGVKIHPDIQRVNIDDERLLRLYALIEGRMPLYVHMGDGREEYPYSRAERLARVMKQFPRLEVVAAHLGGYLQWDAAERLAGTPNLWFDTSSALWAMSPERATHLIRLFGTDRVMFGSDYPIVKPTSEIGRFLALDLSEEERRRILCDNAMRFLHFSH